MHGLLLEKMAPSEGAPHPHPPVLSLPGQDRPFMKRSGHTWSRTWSGHPGTFTQWCLGDGHCGVQLWAWVLLLQASWNFQPQDSSLLPKTGSPVLQ